MRRDYLGFRNKSVRSNNIEGSYSKQSLRIVNIVMLKHFRGNRHGRIHGVGDDTNHCLRASLGGRVHQIRNNARVGVEKVITSHAGLARYSSGDDDHGASLEAIVERLFTVMTGYLGFRFDMTKIGSNAFHVSNIIERKVRNGGQILQKKRKWLTDSAASTKNCDFAFLKVKKKDFIVLVLFTKDFENTWIYTCVL